jgi:hypothetical protein
MDIAAFAVKRYQFTVLQVRVSVEHARLAQLGIPIEQVVAAIRGTNVNVPAGSVEAGGLKLKVKTGGDYTSLQQIEKTALSSDGHATLRLGDVAQLALRDEPNAYIGRYNGVRAAFVTVTQGASDLMGCECETAEQRPSVTLTMQLSPTGNLWTKTHRSRRCRILTDAFSGSCSESSRLCRGIVTWAVSQCSQRWRSGPRPLTELQTARTKSVVSLATY